MSERDFAQLDRLLREKPNASILSLEAIVLFANNKTAKCMVERGISSWTVKVASESQSLWTRIKKKLYQARKRQLLEQCADILQAKQAALLSLQEKKVREKEKLTQAMMIYGLYSATKKESRLCTFWHFCIQNTYTCIKINQIWI